MALYIHVSGTTDSELVRKQEESACARYQGTNVRESSRRSAKFQDFEIGHEVYGMNDWFADGATAEFCITQSRNTGSVRAMELK